MSNIEHENPTYIYTGESPTMEEIKKEFERPHREHVGNVSLHGSDRQVVYTLYFFHYVQVHVGEYCFIKVENIIG